MPVQVQSSKYLKVNSIVHVHEPDKWVNSEVYTYNSCRKNMIHVINDPLRKSLKFSVGLIRPSSFNKLDDEAGPSKSGCNKLTSFRYTCNCIKKQFSTFFI